MRLSRLFAAASALSLGSCSTPFHHGFIAAAGPVADHERHLFVIVCVVMLFVIGPVILLTPVFAWHYRLANTRSAYRPDWAFNWPLEGLIWIPPSLIVVGLAFFLWRDTHALDPYKPLPSAQLPIEVQAIALDWKWLFIYPDQQIATLNELVFPADRTVHLSLTSGTVMQSLLFPQLAGQIYAMAGMTTQLNIAADVPGTYRGENTQFNGEGFQREKFPVLALAPADYEKWFANAKAQPRSLDAATYAKISKRSVVEQPEIFGAVAPGLFQAVLGKDKPAMSAADMTDHQ